MDIEEHNDGEGENKRLRDQKGTYNEKTKAKKLEVYKVNTGANGLGEAIKNANEDTPNTLEQFKLNDSLGSRYGRFLSFFRRGK